MTGHIVNLMRDAQHSYALALIREQQDTLARLYAAADPEAVLADQLLSAPRLEPSPLPHTGDL